MMVATGTAKACDLWDSVCDLGVSKNRGPKLDQNGIEPSSASQNVPLLGCGLGRALTDFRTRRSPFGLLAVHESPLQSQGLEGLSQNCCQDDSPILLLSVRHTIRHNIAEKLVHIM